MFYTNHIFKTEKWKNYVIKDCVNRTTTMLNNLQIKDVVLYCIVYTPSVFLNLVQVILKIQNKLTPLWESDAISKNSLRVIKDIVRVKTLLMTTQCNIYLWMIRFM